MPPRSTFTKTDRQRGPLAFLRGRIVLATLSLWGERLLGAFWPLLTFLGFAYGAYAFGALVLLPAGWSLGALALVMAGLLFIGGLNFTIPTRTQALERLDENLINHPIASLQDSPALNRTDPLALALWQAHIAAMKAEAEVARVPFPAPELARKDPFGLRLLALATLGLALLFAPGAGGIFWPPVTGSGPNATGPSVAIEAWATPPAYTGKPAIYLTELAQGAHVELPIGSEITLRTYGDGNFSLTEGVSGTAAALVAPEAGAPPRDGRFTVHKNGAIEMFDGHKTLGQWQVSVIADAPPTLEAPEGIGKSRKGELSIPYVATDDYGIVSTRYIIHPALERVTRAYGLAPDPIKVPDDFTGDLPLPFTQDLTHIKETLLADYSKEMWAHLPVGITLEVTDGAGQVARVELSTDTLPALRFFDKLAAALVEQRRDLMWSPANDRRVSQVLRAISYKPEDGLFPDASSYLILRSAIHEMGAGMQNGLDDTARAGLEALLWRLALKIENGDLTGAAARLKRAQDRLSQALQNGASKDEIAGLMDNLRQATKDYLSERAKNMAPKQQQAQGQQQTITSDQLQQMLDKIQQLSDSGKTEEAQQLLQDLQKFMDNMQMVQGGSGGQQQSSKQQQLQDGLQQQQQLSDQAFQQLQKQFGLQGKGAQSGQSLADRQEQLRKFVEKMQGQGATREGLSQAQRDMATARDRLRQGDFSGAFDAQAQAMENMRQTLRNMENRQQAGQSGQNGDTPAKRDQYDPLGRPIGHNGRAAGDTAVPDQNASDRARQLLGEIRRRSGEATRPPEELDYLKRLLNRF